MRRHAARRLLVVLVALAPGCAQDAAYVEQLVVANPTSYDVHVEVRSATSAPWLALGTATHGHDTPFSEVVDQGDTWIVRFDYAGLEGGEISVSRAQLVRDKWHVEVPEAVAVRLRDQGVVPPPR
jgi:hypothetical protein